MHLVDRVLTVGTVLVALPATLSLLANQIWWCELLAHFRLHYVVAGLPLLAGWVVRRRWSAAVGMGALLLIVGLTAIPPWRVRPFPPTRGTRLVVANINLLSSNDDHAGVARFVTDSEASVVVVEELTPRWVEALESIPGYTLKGAVPDDEGNFGIGLLVADTAADLVTLRPAWDVDGYPTVEAWIRVGPAVYALLGIHPPPPASRELAGARDATFVEVAAWSRRQRGARRFPIVLGDFNVTPYAPAFRRLIHEGKLVDSRTGVQATFPSSLGPFGLPIDHCLHSRDLVAVERRVGPDVGSDHRPIVVTLVRRSRA